MITNVKMEVTPDLSERVQEIVFANGGRWMLGSIKILNTSKTYLFLNKNKELTCCDNYEIFKESNFKEVSAYDFIASQGEQEWLPRYEEKALFSIDREEWTKQIFKYYEPQQMSSYIANSNYYVYCKPLPKQISFTQFLKDNNAYEAYMENVKIENQRWNKKEKYKTLEERQKSKSKGWIWYAFEWLYAKKGIKYWDNLNTKWTNLCENNEVVWDDR